jgi:hypothetical protein
VPTEFALFPTRVPGIKLFHYPDRDEMFKMSERTVNKNVTFSPNVQAGGVGGSFGSLSRQEARTLYGILHLRPQTACHDEIQWSVVLCECLVCIDGNLNAQGIHKRKERLFPFIRKTSTTCEESWRISMFPI